MYLFFNKMYLKYIFFFINTMKVNRVQCFLDLILRKKKKQKKKTRVTINYWLYFQHYLCYLFTIFYMHFIIYAA